MVRLATIAARAEAIAPFKAAILPPPGLSLIHIFFGTDNRADSFYRKVVGIQFIGVAIYIDLTLGGDVYKRQVQWTQLEKKDYTNFTTRLAGLIGLYRRDGLNYREPFRQQADSTATEKK